MQTLEERLEQAVAPVVAARDREEKKGRAVLKEAQATFTDLERGREAALEALGQDAKAYKTAEEAQVAAEMRRRNQEGKLKKLAEKPPHVWALEMQTARADAERAYQRELREEINRLSEAMRTEEDPQRYLMLQGKRNDLEEMEMEMVVDVGTSTERRRLRDLTRNPAAQYDAVTTTVGEFLQWVQEPEEVEPFWAAVLLTLYRDQVAVAVRGMAEAAGGPEAQVQVCTGTFWHTSGVKKRELAVILHSVDRFGKKGSVWLLEIDTQGRTV